MREMVVNDWKKAGLTREDFEKLWEATDNEAMKKGKITRRF